ncbi:dynein axonemal intermediate chain 7 isoform X2 [Sceloporus undulatus]|uniref:dynein axonemal intermediate chain 7 isoform X2 n=1 Tax=Sceloporus undulatus TaxID=8520 RepID=UPI001C4B1C38|nr:dynein axonemal intermediate chain 7 isoform X2 [Sceloporus undulatus]
MSAGGKKKLSKAERLRLLREEEERRLLEEEQARIRAELEEAARIEKERIEREKTERLEAKDQERRGIEFSELNVLEESFLSASQWKMKNRALAKWEHYTGCDGSPDPMVVQEINTFMSLWREETNNDIHDVIEKGSRILQLIDKLELCILDTPFHELSPEDVNQYQNTILQLQDLLHHKYNEATEQLLKQASSYAESESGNMEVVIKKKNITLCVWANLKKNPRFRSQRFYDEQKEPCNGFELPKPLAICDIAVRILHTHYDHVSPFQTFPTEPPKLEMPMRKTVIPVSSVDKKSKRAQTSPSVLSSKSDHTANRSRSVSTTFASEEVKTSVSVTENTEFTIKKSSTLVRTVSRAHVSALQMVSIFELEPLEEFVVDLHQFMSVGGIYHFNALKLPPQAKQVKGWTMVQVLDTGLEVCPYTAVCEENEDPSLITVGITIQLLDSVIFFEEPLIGRWNPHGKCWRTDDIGEVVYNMKEKEISFKMNGFFTITLLQDAHLNMPYQSWELRPTGLDEAVFTILTTFAELQIEIKVNQCMLATITTMEDTDLLSEIRGKWMTPLALLLALKRAGMNIFPAEYSPKYVSVNKKLLLAEVTTYQQMALVASAFAFSWSKWNLESGDDNVVFKACEHLTQEPITDGEWALYMFSGQRAQRLEITEESQVFSKNIAEDTEFHSTLYHLIRDASSEEGMERVNHTHYLFIDAVYHLLLATKVLTYS